MTPTLSDPAVQVRSTLVPEMTVATRFDGGSGSWVSGVVAAAVFENPDRFPAASRAFTLYEYGVPLMTLVSENVVTLPIEVSKAPPR